MSFSDSKINQGIASVVGFGGGLATVHAVRKIKDPIVAIGILALAGMAAAWGACRGNKLIKRASQGFGVGESLGVIYRLIRPALYEKFKESFPKDCMFNSPKLSSDFIEIASEYNARSIDATIPAKIRELNKDWLNGIGSILRED